MIWTVFQVALGGAIGASLRYLVGVGLHRALGQTAFPVGVISVNILGSLLMGIFVGLAAQRGLTHLSPFVMTGILGGFTTFSSFSLEVITLYERGDLGLAAAYILGSVILSLVAIFLGLLLTRVALP